MPGLVSLNVVALTLGIWPLVFVTSFAISYVWAGSVRGIAASLTSRWDQVAYATGAGCGALVGALVGRAFA
jgi:hypothetical protein